MPTPEEIEAVRELLKNRAYFRYAKDNLNLEQAMGSVLFQRVADEIKKIPASLMVVVSIQEDEDPSVVKFIFRIITQEIEVGIGSGKIAGIAKIAKQAKEHVKKNISASFLPIKEGYLQLIIQEINQIVEKKHGVGVSAFVKICESYSKPNCNVDQLFKEIEKTISGFRGVNEIKDLFDGYYQYIGWEIGNAVSSHPTNDNYRAALEHIEAWVNRPQYDKAGFPSKTPKHIRELRDYFKAVEEDGGGPKVQFEGLMKKINEITPDEKSRFRSKVTSKLYRDLKGIAQKCAPEKNPGPRPSR